MKRFTNQPHRIGMFRTAAPLLFTLLFHFAASAQTLNLPARPADAPSGTAFAQSLIPLAGPSVSNNRNFSAREAAICGQILQGNIPTWMRQLTLISTNGVVNGTNHTISYYVTPDYLAVGSDTDYFLTPMTPLLGQYLANKLNCTMPTSKMVNQIWSNAPCKLSPSTIPASPEMTTVPVFIDHNTAVRTQRNAVINTRPFGTLVGGDKKDVIISGRIYTAFASPSITNTVVIYGWHQSNGSPIQGVYNGHEETYADYSHGIRLVQMNVTLDGQPNTVTNILVNPNLAGLISNDPYYTSNTIPVPRYRTFNPVAPIITTPPVSQSVASNATVSLRAFAIGDGTLGYQWRRNGTNILNATNATLTITNIQSSGTYMITVTNSLGSANASATLTVTATTPVRFESIGPAAGGAVEVTLSGAAGESYVVEASTNLVAWKPISVLSITNGPLPFVDPEAVDLASRFYKAGQSATSWLNNFETSAIGSGNMFLNPVSSGSTLSYLTTNSPTFSFVTNNLPEGNGSSNALAVGWTFNQTASSWLRLTTFNAPQVPNPTISLTNHVLLFDIYTTNSVYVAVGLRETGTAAAIGADGGATGSIEWVGTTTTAPPRGKLIPTGQWTTLQFFIPHETVRGFTGDGILTSATGKGVLEHLAFAPASGETVYRVLLDNFRVVELRP